MVHFYMIFYKDCAHTRGKSNLKGQLLMSVPSPSQEINTSKRRIYYGIKTFVQGGGEREGRDEKIEVVA